MGSFSLALEEKHVFRMRFIVQVIAWQPNQTFGRERRVTFYIAPLDAMSHPS